MSTMKEITERANEIFKERWDEAKLEFDEVEKYVEGLDVHSR